MRYLFFLLAIPLFAQPNNGFQRVTTVPSGFCSAVAIPRLLIPNGVIYTCQSGTWGDVSGTPSALGFNSLVNGTNTTATMTCGTGCLLQVSGSGVIQASTVSLPGSDGQVTYRKSGVPASDSGLAYNDSTKSLGVIGTLVTGQSGTATGQINFNGKTSGTTSLKSADAASGSLLLPNANDTLVGKDTPDTFTHKTFDTAGTGNSFKIAGTAITAVSGTGDVCLSSGSACGGSPAFNAVASGTNTTATMNCGTGCLLQTSGFGVIHATDAQGLSPVAHDTVILNASGSTQGPGPVAMPTTGTNGCAGANEALQYNTTTHDLICAAISGSFPDPGSNGLTARTALNTLAARSIAAGSGISVSNGDGVTGDPTVSVNTAVVTSITSLQQGDATTVISAVGTDAYAGSPASGCGGVPTALTNGMVLWLYPDVSNTGAATFAPCGLTAKAIKTQAGADPADNTILAHKGVPLMLDTSAGAGSEVWVLPPEASGFPASAAVIGTNSSSQPVASTATEMSGPTFCSDAGASDTYACNLSPAIASYVTGTHYRFKANTANTGTASINFNSKGALTLVKAAGGITTTLSDNDIRAGQWVDCVYDGTNCQMQSTLGNAAASGGYATIQTTGPGGAQPAPTSQTTQTTANFLFPLKAANNGGNSSTDVSVVGPCDPRKMVCIYDDFWSVNAVSGNAVQSTQQYWNNVFNNATISIDDPSPSGIYGDVVLDTSTTSGGAISLRGSGANGAGLGNYSATTFDYLVRFQLSSTTNVNMQMGFKGNDSPYWSNSTDGIGIVYDTGSGDTNFMCVAKAASTSTRTSIGVAADTSIHLGRIRSTTAGTILCSIDGGTEVSVSTNVPTVFLGPAWTIINTAAESKKLTLDYWWHEFDITR